MGVELDVLHTHAPVTLDRDGEPCRTGTSACEHHAGNADPRSRIFGVRRRLGSCAAGESDRSLWRTPCRLRSFHSTAHPRLHTQDGPELDARSGPDSV